VTLFVFMNLSNWPVIVDALAQTTNQFAWLYFALWYLSITICVLNIVTAFILEDFQLMKAFVEDERRLVPAWKVVCCCVSAFRSLYVSSQFAW
jgi:hypothetical protein